MHDLIHQYMGVVHMWCSCTVKSVREKDVRASKQRCASEFKEFSNSLEVRVCRTSFKRHNFKTC